jgi:hypothetical protein
MEYETPTVEVVGPASRLIHAYAGPTCDGNGYVHGQGLTCSALEEEWEVESGIVCPRFLFSLLHRRLKSHFESIAMDEGE